MGFAVERQRNRLVQHRRTALYQRLAARSMPAQRQVLAQRFDPLRQLHLRSCRTRPTSADAVLRQHDGQLHVRSCLHQSGLDATAGAGRIRRRQQRSTSTATVTPQPRHSFRIGPHTGWVHPNGTTQDGVAAPNFTATSPTSYSLDYWQPRFSATYTSIARYRYPALGGPLHAAADLGLGPVPQRSAATTGRCGTTR